MTDVMSHNEAERQRALMGNETPKDVLLEELLIK